MSIIVEFSPRLLTDLPETGRILESANLQVHPAVTRIILHGSRGLAGGYRPDSDVDLSLLIDFPTETKSLSSSLELLDAIAHTTLDAWRAEVEVDLAVIFDQRGCGLKCFDCNEWDDQNCSLGGVGCFGLYKVQKGFNGLVDGSGIEVKRMYPCLKIWQRGRKQVE